MKIGLFFWILMLVWLLFGAWSYWPHGSTAVVAYGPIGGGLLLFLLVGILGWKVFGAPLQA